VDRNTLLWTVVLFFGASIMFATIREASQGEGTGVALAAQATAGVLLVSVIYLFIKRRR
jgi:hypothetical protein